MSWNKPSRAPTFWKQEFRDIKIRHVGPSHSAINKIASKAEEDLRLDVDMIIEKDDEIINRAINDPESMDIFDLDYWAFKIVLPKGLLQGIPISKYQWWDKTLSLFKTGKLPNNMELSPQGTMPYTVQYLENTESTEFSNVPTDTICMIPHMMNADSLGVRTDLIGRSVDSWADLLNTEFAGRTALVNIPDIGIMDAAMAFEADGRIKYVNKGDMTREEIDKTIDSLIELKKNGHFHGFWSTYEESVNQFSLGNVVIQSMWSPAVSEVSARGIECDYPKLREGYRGWASGLGIMRHVQGTKLEAVYEYLNWYNSGWVGSFIAREGYYSPVPETIKQFMTQNEWDYWYEGKPATESIVDMRGRIEAQPGDIRMGGPFWDRIGNIACWNTVMKENDYLIKRWNEFINL